MLETLLINAELYKEMGEEIVNSLLKKDVELFIDPIIKKDFPALTIATDEHFETEFHDLKLAIKVVNNIEEAISHINEFSSGHTEAILTESTESADLFTSSIDSSVLFVNSSTRFTDGEMFGFGAEIGISTQKLHVRGPMGLEALTSEKYVVKGNGQIRKMSDKKLQIKDFEKNNYFATQELVDVVNAALFLDKPLLIEGPAGTGKTYLAKSLSNMLSRELIRLQCHEGIDEDKAIYEWDYKKQLLSIQNDKNEKDLFTDEYLIERPILKSLKTSDSLFLVDEIDRSDEEFEALLLEVLAEKQVTIPELGTVAGEGNNFTILTSNATRDLSEALRRRCIYFFL